MNHLTLHAYEEDGELFVYRCPVCGSTGPSFGACIHEAPCADNYKGCDAVPRKPVRVPGVGEEPRYTLERLEEELPTLLGDPGRYVLRNDGEQVKEWQARAILHFVKHGGDARRIREAVSDA